MMVVLHDTRFVKCWWWNDGWTVKTVVTWRSSGSMIPAPGQAVVPMSPWCQVPSTVTVQVPSLWLAMMWTAVSHVRVWMSFWNAEEEKNALTIWASTCDLRGYRDGEGSRRYSETYVLNIKTLSHIYLLWMLSNPHPLCLLLFVCFICLSFALLK